MSKVYFYVVWSDENGEEGHAFDCRDTMDQVADAVKDYGQKYPVVIAKIVEGSLTKISIERDDYTDGYVPSKFEPPARIEVLTDQLASMNRPVAAGRQDGRRHGGM